MTAVAAAVVSARDRFNTGYEASAVLPVLYVDPRSDPADVDDLVQQAIDRCDEKSSLLVPAARIPWLMRLGWLRAERDPRASISSFQEALTLASSLGPEQGDRDREAIVAAASALAQALRRAGSPEIGLRLLDEHIHEHDTSSTASMVSPYHAERALCRLSAGHAPPSVRFDLSALGRESASVAPLRFASAVSFLFEGEAQVAFDLLALPDMSGARQDVPALLERAAALNACFVLLEEVRPIDSIELVALCREMTEIVRALQARADIHDRRSPISSLIREARRVSLRELAIASGVPDAGLLGFELTLGVKQSGVASFIRRRQRESFDDLTRSLSRTLRDLTNSAARRIAPTVADDEETNAEFRLRSEVSDLFADLASPIPLQPSHVAAIVEVAKGTHFLDFVSLPDGPQHRWYRVWIRPDGRCNLDEIDGARDGSIDDLDEMMADITDALSAEGDRPALLWRQLGARLIPAELWSLLFDASALDPPPHILVSPFGEMTRVPWAALRPPATAPESFRCLIDRAIVTIVPCASVLGNITTIRRHLPASIVRLSEGLDTGSERKAWTQLGVRPLDATEFENVLVAVPARDAVVQVSAHGRGVGLDQSLMIPHPLTALRALTLRWPHTVLLLCCHTGRILVEEAEAFGFTISCLAGGASEVLSGLHAISDASTGRIGASVIEQMAVDPEARLPCVLREAQLSELDDRPWKPARTWALLASYVNGASSLL